MNQEFSKTGLNDEERISNLIGSLPRVEAPGDFDFRVRARIAAGRPAENRGSWLPASVRYAVPLALVLAIGGYVGFNAIYVGDVTDVPAVAELQPSTASIPVAEVPARVESAASQPVAERIETTATDVAVKPPTVDADKLVPPAARKTEKPGGGSYVDAGTAAKTIEANTNVAPIEPEKPEDKTALTGIALLAAARISTAPAGRGWKVVSVSAGGSGAASGVQAGDVIEAISGRTLRIRRDGVIMRVVLN